MANDYLNDGNYLSHANWHHLKSGVSYHIFGFSTRESDGVTLVHYRKAMDSTAPIWTRTAAEFFDGRFVRLFPGIKLPDPTP